MTRHKLLHNYLLQKKLHSNTTKLNTKAIIILLILLHIFWGPHMYNLIYSFIDYKNRGIIHHPILHIIM